jgi:hypothetical protein
MTVEPNLPRFTAPAVLDRGGCPNLCCIIVTLQTKSQAAGQPCRQCEQRHFMHAGAAFDAATGAAGDASQGRKTSAAAGFS